MPHHRPIPENAIDFVSFFVQDAWASGVIGTEITVFEPSDKPRIALLARRNPFGLAHVPFVLPAIHYVRYQNFDWFAAAG